MVIACSVTSQSIEATLSRTANEVFFKLENALYYADPLAVSKRQAAPRYETNLPHSVLKQWKKTVLFFSFILGAFSSNVSFHGFRFDLVFIVCVFSLVCYVFIFVWHCILIICFFDVCVWLLKEPFLYI